MTLNEKLQERLKALPQQTEWKLMDVPQGSSEPTPQGNTKRPSVEELPPFLSISDLRNPPPK